MSITRFFKDTKTIAISSSLSSTFSLGDSGVLQAIEIPSSWTTANITFQAVSSGDGSGTFVDVYDADGNEVTAVVGGASRIIAVDPTIFAGFTHIKVRSGTSGTPVNQAAERDIIILKERR